MRDRVREIISARGAAFALVAALVAASATACELDGASKKPQRDGTASSTQLPRTNLPMPPAETARKTSEGSQAPRGNWTHMDGRREGLEDYKGQVVVLDFWATYCPPCRDEIPHLVKLQRRFGPQGFAVVGLNVGGDDDRPKVPDFVKQYGIQYRLAEPDEQTVNLFLAGDSRIPQTFVIDRRGRLVKQFVGYDGEIAAELERAIETALAGKPSD